MKKVKGGGVIVPMYFALILLVIVLLNNVAAGQGVPCKNYKLAGATFATGANSEISYMEYGDKWGLPVFILDAATKPLYQDNAFLSLFPLNLTCTSFHHLVRAGAIPILLPATLRR